jgi:hypothetical protein
MFLGGSVTWSIHLEHVEIPGVVAVGESPTLVCDVDLEPGELYSVKWYKDNDEFYRFMPKREPNTQTYPVEGINVDVSLSIIFTPIDALALLLFFLTCPTDSGAFSKF